MAVSGVHDMTTQTILCNLYDYGSAPVAVTVHNPTTLVLTDTANTVTKNGVNGSRYAAVFTRVSVLPAGVYAVGVVVNGVPGLLYATLAGVDGEVVSARSEIAAVLDSATRVKLDASQPDYAPAKASDVAVTVTPTVLSSQSVTDIQTGLATSTALADVQTDVDAANNYLSALSTIFAGITSMANWLRRGFRKDAGTQGMIDAQAEINTGGTSTFSGLTDSLEAIRDNQQASTGGASLEDIIAGVQSVSGGIIAAQDESALYITIGDTWTQDVESLGNLADKTVTFAIKTKARDADTAAVVMIVQGTGLTRLNGAATTAGWGSIEILDEAAGDIRLRLESDATSLLTSGTYVDAIKALEDGDDRTLRQRGRTVVSVGVIADIT